MSEVSQDKGAESATVPEQVVDPVAAQADLESRLAGFNVELKAICDKYGMKLIAEPRIDVNTGRVVAEPKVIDARAAVKGVAKKDEPIA